MCADDFLAENDFFETFFIDPSTDQRVHVDFNASERMLPAFSLLSGSLLSHRSIFANVSRLLDIRKIRQLVIGGFLKELTYSRGKYL
jgi:hypothetical protein